MLKEGETSNMSSSRHLWELAVWEHKSGLKDVYAVDTKDLDSGDSIRLEDLELELQVQEYYKNCTAISGRASPERAGNIINASGIRVLKGKQPAAEVEDNIAGGIFAIIPTTGARQRILLYGRESIPTPVTVNGRSIFFSLRRKRLILPLSLTLLDFKVTLYPNSEIPKSYKSRVTIKSEQGLERDVVISMNKPLRYKDLTFFQSSYYTAPDGSEFTILAVVKNIGRLLPYISSLWIFLGLVIHFLMKLSKGKIKIKDKS